MLYEALCVPNIVTNEPLLTELH